MCNDVYQGFCGSTSKFSNGCQEVSQLFTKVAKEKQLGVLGNFGLFRDAVYFPWVTERFRMLYNDTLSNK